MPPAGGTVRVDADLDVRVDGHTVTVSAAGDEVRVDVSDPAAVLAVLTSTALPVGSTSPFTRHVLGRVAGTLADGGLTLTVEGPSGRLAELGAHARGARWTRLLLGDHVAIGAWAAVGPAVRPVVVSVLRRARIGLVARLRRR